MKGLIIGRGVAGARHARICVEGFGDIECLHLGARSWDSMMKAGPRGVEEFWFRNDPSWAVVASPANRHLEHIASVLNFDVPVLVEKPLTTKGSLANDFLDVFREKALQIQIGYVLRHSPSYQRFRHLITGLGVTSLAKVTVRAHSFLPDWRPMLDYRESVSARLELGGGALLELSHEIDYLLDLFGDFKVHSAMLRSEPLLALDVETECEVWATIQGGANLEISLSMSKPFEERWCEVEWEDGLRIRWDLQNQMITQGHAAKILVNERFPADRNDWYRAQFDHFLRVASGAAVPLPGIDEGVRVMRVIDEVRSANAAV